MEIDSWLRRLSLLISPAGMSKKREKLVIGSIRESTQMGLCLLWILCLDSLPNVMQSQTKLLPLLRDS